MIMVGCENEEGRNYATDERGYTYEVTVIDSCEYFHSTYILAHKGNCRFCKERRQKELKELVKQLEEK